MVIIAAAPEVQVPAVGIEPAGWHADLYLARLWEQFPVAEDVLPAFHQQALAWLAVMRGPWRLPTRRP